MRLHIEYSKHSFFIMFDPHHLYYPKKRRTTRKAQIIQKRAIPYVPTPLSLQQLKQAYEYFERNGYDTVKQPKQYSHLYNTIAQIENLTVQSQDSSTITFFDIYDAIIKPNFQFIPETVKSFEVLFYVQQIEVQKTEAFNSLYNIVNRAAQTFNTTKSVEFDSYTQLKYQIRSNAETTVYYRDYLTEEPYIWLQQYYTNNKSDYIKFKNPSEETRINTKNDTESYVPAALLVF